MSKQMVVFKNGTQKDVYTTDGDFVGSSFQNPDGSENFYSADGSTAGSTFQTGFGTNTFLSNGSAFSTFDNVPGAAYGTDCLRRGNRRYSWHESSWRQCYG